MELEIKRYDEIIEELKKPLFQCRGFKEAIEESLLTSVDDMIDFYENTLHCKDKAEYYRGKKDAYLNILGFFKETLPNSILNFGKEEHDEKNDRKSNQTTTNPART